MLWCEVAQLLLPLTLRQLGYYSSFSSCFLPRVRSVTLSALGRPLWMQEFAIAQSTDMLFMTWSLVTIMSQPFILTCAFLILTQHPCGVNINSFVVESHVVDVL